MMSTHIESAVPHASPQAQLPATSLIICSRNRPQLLWETVESVLAGEAVPTELVVVDQSDVAHVTLATLQAKRACSVRYMWEHSVGLSRARNAGIAAAQHDIVAIIDDDMFVARNWFSSLIGALLDAAPRTVVTGRVLAAPSEARGGFVPALVLDEAPAVYAGRLNKDVLAGGHMAACRSTFAEVGGFDERLGAGGAFPAADDNDLGFRLLEAGYRIRYAPEAVVYHRAWRSDREYLRMRWNYGRGKGGYYTKHLRLHDRYMLRRAIWDIGQRVAAFPHRMVHQRRQAYGDGVYVLGIVCAAVQWLLTQRGKRG